MYEVPRLMYMHHPQAACATSRSAVFTPRERSSSSRSKVPHALRMDDMVEILRLTA